MQKVGVINDVTQKNQVFKADTEKQAVASTQKTSTSNSSNFITGLAAIASIAVAGIALYKNHSAAGELKSINKKLSEAESKLQNTLEEKQKDIKEAVDKAVKDLEEKNKQLEEQNKTLEEKLKGDKQKSKPIYVTPHYTSTDSGIGSLRKAGKKARKPNKKKELTEEEKIQEGLKYLEEQEKIAQREKHILDLKIEQSEKEQHRLKEKELNDWYNVENKDAFDAIARNIENNIKEEEARQAAHIKNQAEYEKMFEDEAQAISTMERKAKRLHFKNKIVNMFRNLFPKKETPVEQPQTGNRTGNRTRKDRWSIDPKKKYRSLKKISEEEKQAMLKTMRERQRLDLLAETQAQTQRIHELQDKYGYTPKKSIKSRIKKLFSLGQEDIYYVQPKPKNKAKTPTGEAFERQEMKAEAQAQTQRIRELQDKYGYTPKKSIMTNIKDFFGNIKDFFSFNQAA